MIIRSLTIVLAFGLAFVILFEHWSGNSLGGVPYILLFVLTPLFIYERRRRKRKR